MPKLKVQDANWVIYQPDGKPARWDLDEALRKQYARAFRGVSQEEIDAFLSSHFLDALENILDEQDWDADFNGYTGEIEITARQGDLQEENIRQWMEAAMDDAVEMLVDALRDGYC